MSDEVKTLPWKPKKINLNPDQRLLIETAHGLIEINGGERAVRLVVLLPPDLRFRKGDKKETVLHSKYLDASGEPNFTLLSPVKSDPGHELKQVKAISAQ